MSTDEQLMDAYVRRGDHGAFAAIHARYAGLIRSVVMRHLYGSSDADDMVQQVFMQLHLARQRYRAGDSLRPWLCTIAINACRDQGRKRARRAETQLDLERLDALPQDRPSAIKEATLPIMRALESLSDVTQRIFREHFLEERALVDIARDLGENPSTVRVRLHRGCLDLRARLVG
jgi:RNA polymerase sigma factor (sigma-70 family)